MVNFEGLYKVIKDFYNKEYNCKYSLNDMFVLNIFCDPENIFLCGKQNCFDETTMNEKYNLSIYVDAKSKEIKK